MDHLNYYQDYYEDGFNNELFANSGAQKRQHEEDQMEGVSASKKGRINHEEQMQIGHPVDGNRANFAVPIQYVNNPYAVNHLRNAQVHYPYAGEIDHGAARARPYQRNVEMAPPMEVNHDDNNNDSNNNNNNIQPHLDANPLIRQFLFDLRRDVEESERERDQEVQRLFDEMVEMENQHARGEGVPRADEHRG